MSKANKIKNPNGSKWLDIRKALKYASQRDLLGLIGELYLLSKSNKDFLEARFIRDEKVIFKYKALIKKHLAPNPPWRDSQRISLKDAKKTLSDYKKATGDKIGLIDLMIYYVECGTDFLCEYGDMYENYYISLESVFDSALKFMKQYEDHEIEDFIYRLQEVVRKAGHMGCGYYDAISDMMKEAYPKLA